MYFENVVWLAKRWRQCSSKIGCIEYLLETGFLLRTALDKLKLDLMMKKDGEKHQPTYSLKASSPNIPPDLLSDIIIQGGPESR